MDIDKLTIGEARQLATMFPQPLRDDSHWKIGAIYLIRTVTITNTGRLVAVTPQELVLEDAAWIADTGRFADALAKMSFNRIEPFPNGRVIVGRGVLIDAVEIHQVQRNQK